jgi:hypothetical protein
MTARLCGSSFAVGVRDYVARFAFDNTDSSDLIACLAKVQNTVYNINRLVNLSSKASGKDVEHFVKKVSLFQFFVECIHY